MATLTIGGNVMTVRTNPKVRVTSWDDIGVVRKMAQIWRFVAGFSEDSPSIFKVIFPPHSTVASHYHESDYADIFLEGSQKINGRWFHTGDIRVVKGGTVYGPLVTGAEGATVLVVFANGNKDATLPVRPGGVVESWDGSALRPASAEPSAP
jgi:hypothetical protein